MSTILKLLNLDPVEVCTTAYPLNLPASNTVVDKELVFGCELEIEGVPQWDRLEIHNVGSTNDGSLRNHGREFLMRPQKYGDAVATLTEFYRSANLNDTNYSDRTSIHVHTNCQDLSIDELQIILFNYQIAESLLFGWLNSGRENNIFCVPWSQTNLSYQMFDGKRDIRKFKQWAKYTALNLLPLYELGTIEWRHMEGHCNTAKLFKWLQIISCFYRYARNNKIDAVKESLMALNTTSHYGQYVESVFQEHSDFIYTQPNWQRHLEDGVLLMKYAMTPSIAVEKSAKATAGFFQDNPVQNTQFGEMNFDVAVEIHNEPQRVEPHPMPINQLPRPRRLPPARQAAQADRSTIDEQTRTLQQLARMALAERAGRGD